MADEDIDVLVDYVAVVAHPDAAEAPVATGEEHAFDGSEARRRLPFVYDAREGYDTAEARALLLIDPVFFEQRVACGGPCERRVHCQAAAGGPGMCCLCLCCCCFNGVA